MRYQKGLLLPHHAAIIGSCYVKAMYTLLDKACVVIAALGKLIIQARTLMQTMYYTRAS